MKYTLRFLTEVEGDTTAAYEWYEEHAAGLGEGFLPMQRTSPCSAADAGRWDDYLDPGSRHDEGQGMAPCQLGHGGAPG